MKEINTFSLKNLFMLKKKYYLCTEIKNNAVMMNNFETIADRCLKGEMSGTFVIALTNRQRVRTHSSLLRKNLHGYYFESPFGLVGRTYLDRNGFDITNPRMFDVIDFEKD